MEAAGPDVYTGDTGYINTWTLNLGGGSSATCAEVTRTGSLTSGASSYQPSTTGFTAAAGTIKGCLDGPTGTDFDLYLQKLSGSTWSNVASGTTSAPDETVTYTSAAGTYRWQLHAYSGSGSWSLGFDCPEGAARARPRRSPRRGRVAPPRTGSVPRES